MRKRSSFWHEFVPKSWIILKNQYSMKLFKGDLFAGVTVGIVALPLSMAFAMASGVSPEKGIYTAIIAGFLTSLLGGSRFQIGGPTGAFVVIIYGIVQREGYEGLVLASLLAGVFLLIAAFSRMGSLIKYIPYPLVTGFTTGIAVVIFSSQVVDFFGLKIAKVPADFIPKWMAIFSSFSTWNPLTCGVAFGTFVLILLIRRFLPIVPWAIGSVATATAVCYGFNLPVETIASRFGAVSSSLPVLSFVGFSFSISEVHSLVVNAMTIAFLAAVESLLSAVVADGMAGTRHRSNCELMAQGVANIGSALFGGIPSTGAIARTAINVKVGGKTPVAGMIHAVILTLIILFFSSVVGKIPLAALSALLVMVAWNMAELDRFHHLFKAPKGDVVVLLTAFFLTVLVDLTVAVSVGMVLASFLFMKRVSSTSSVMSLSSLEKSETEEAEKQDLVVFQERKAVLKGIEVYDVTGPFLFGVADSLKSILSEIELPPKVFILRIHKVPIIDASGMHALREFYEKCHREKTEFLLSGINPLLRASLKKYGLITLIGEEKIFLRFDEALKRAEALMMA